MTDQQYRKMRNDYIKHMERVPEREEGAGALCMAVSFGIGVMFGMLLGILF